MIIGIDRMPFYISPPPRNPLTAILAALAGGLLMVGAFFLGFVVLVVALGLGLLIWLAVLLRVKWLQRGMRKHGVDPFSRAAQRSGSRTEALETEYTVVSRHTED
jgi:hypothetical protein